MVVRELVALLGVKTDKKGFGDAEGGIQSIVKWAKVAAVAVAGIAAGRAVWGLAKDVAEAGDRLDKMSKRTGIAADTLQKLGHVAALGGASLSDIEMSIKRLQAASSDASFGLKTYTREFDRLGISIKDEQGNFKDTTQLLLEVADGMKNLDSDTERTAVAVKLLGRSGTTLIPTLKQGSEAIREQMEEVEALGGLMGQDMVQASADFIDNQQRMTVAIDGLKLAVGRELLPIFLKMQDSVIGWWKANRKWIAENIAPKIKEVVLYAGRLAKTLVNVVKWISKFVWNLPKPAKILLVGLAFLKWGKYLKVFLSPFGKVAILAALLILIFEDLQTWVEGGDSVFGKFFDTLSELTGLDISTYLKNIIKWFGRFSDDPVRATEEIYQTFAELKKEMEDFSGPTAAIVGYFDVMKEGAAAAFLTFIEPIRFLIDSFNVGVPQAFQNSVQRMGELWDGFVKTLLTVFNNVFGVDLLAAWDELKENIGERLTSIQEAFFVVWDRVAAGFREHVIAPLNSAWEAFKNSVIGKIVIGTVQGLGMTPSERAERDKGSPGGATPPSPGGLGKTLEGARKVVGAAGQMAAPRAAMPGPAAARGGMTNAPTNNISIDVNATGGSPGAIATELKKVVRAELDRQNRNTMKALMPEAL